MEGEHFETPPATERESASEDQRIAAEETRRRMQAGDRTASFGTVLAEIRQGKPKGARAH